MIESYYWRKEIKADVRWLRVKQRFKRWSEKQLVLYERKLMVLAFQVRTLLERPKVNDRVKSLKLNALRFPKVGKKPFTLAGAGWPEDRFDLSSPEKVELSVLDVCNQLIHHYWMSTHAEVRGCFSSVLVFSDYKRRICAYEFDVSALIDLFAPFGDDESTICSMTLAWDEKKQDYVVKHAGGPSDTAK